MSYLNVGYIAGTHGLHGEVKVVPTTDFIELRFKPGNILWLEHKDYEPSFTLTIASTRSHKKFILLKFTEWDSIDLAEKARGGVLRVSGSQLPAFDPEEYHFQQLLGCSVLTTDNRELGIVADIMPLPAHEVLVVRNINNEETLIPFVTQIVTQVDTSTKTITVTWLEGMGS